MIPGVRRKKMPKQKYQKETLHKRLRQRSMNKLSMKSREKEENQGSTRRRRFAKENERNWKEQENQRENTRVIITTRHMTATKP